MTSTVFFIAESNGKDWCVHRENDGKFVGKITDMNDGSDRPFRATVSGRSRRLPTLLGAKRIASAFARLGN